MFGEVLERPWRWLAAIADAASTSGDHELVGICAVCVRMWQNNILTPMFSPYERQFWLVSTVPDDVRIEVRDLALISLGQIQEDRGDETAEITGWPAASLPILLG